MAYTDLTQIQEKINTHKSNLAANLAAKSVNANSSETLAVLIGKVKDIEQGGGGSGEGGLDWSQITDMEYAFYRCNEQAFEMFLKSINCDMRQVTDWQYAFYQAIITDNANDIWQANKIPITKLSQSMFYNCTYLKNIEFEDDIDGDGTTAGAKNCFGGCTRLPLNKATAFFYNHPEDSSFKLESAFELVGTVAEKAGTVTIDDFTLRVSTFNRGFYGCTNLLKFGNFTNPHTSALNIQQMFGNCSSLQEVGLITTQALNNSSYNVFNGCNKLKKIHGFSVPSQKYQGEIITSSSYRLISSSSLTALEECLNIPVGYFRYGGANIGLAGTASAVKPLKRLTFCQSDEGYYTKNYAKNLTIQYCSFDRDGMLEVFNTLPDASDVTVTSTITITGNPCVNDGTLTEEDIAIATAKGYVVTTA